MLLSIVMTLLPGLLTSVIALLAGIFLQRMANRYNKQKEIRVMIENIYRNTLEISQLNDALYHPKEDATQTFCSVISKFFKKKGYSYF